MSYNFWSVKQVKHAVKKHKCDECCQSIQVGEPYQKWAANVDGDFWYGCMHKDCADWASEVMTTEDGSRPFLHEVDPEEWLDHWVNPPPSVAARLPKKWAAMLLAPPEGA